MRMESNIDHVIAAQLQPPSCITKGTQPSDTRDLLSLLKEAVEIYIFK